MKKSIAVIIPVLGHQTFTKSLLEDVTREANLVDVFIIDNKGDYKEINSETIIRNQENIGWLRSCNQGINKVISAGYKAVVLLNNDARLSPGFFKGLTEAHQDTQAPLIGPMYDDVWNHQSVYKKTPASEYKSRRFHSLVPFVDGTRMCIQTKLIQEIGLLDKENFGKYGWAADIDYGLRTRKAGYPVCVTMLSYLNHFRGTTAKALRGNYNQLAEQEMNAGLVNKWGEDWRKKAFSPLYGTNLQEVL